MKKELKRKSQITFYIITFLLFIILISYYFYLSKNKITNKEKDLDLKANSVKRYIEECLKERAIKGIYLISEQGGYIDPEINEKYGDFDQVNWERSGILKIPYWYFNERDISPSLSQVEKKLGRYIIIESRNCTNIENMTLLNGISIDRNNVDIKEIILNKSEIYIEVNINNKDVEIKYYYPITLTDMNGNKIKIDKYIMKIPIPLGNNYEIGKEILNRAKKEKNFYNIKKDCKNLISNTSNININSINKRIVIIDYTPHLKYNYRPLRFQYVYTDLNIIGFCIE